MTFSMPGQLGHAMKAVVSRQAVVFESLLLAGETIVSDVFLIKVEVPFRILEDFFLFEVEVFIRIHLISERCEDFIINFLIRFAGRRQQREIKLDRGFAARSVSRLTSSCSCVREGRLTSSCSRVREGAVIFGLVTRVNDHWASLFPIRRAWDGSVDYGPSSFPSRRTWDVNIILRVVFKYLLV